MPNQAASQQGIRVYSFRTQRAGTEEALVHPVGVDLIDFWMRVHRCMLVEDEEGGIGLTDLVDLQGELAVHVDPIPLLSSVVVAVPFSAVPSALKSDGDALGSSALANLDKRSVFGEAIEVQPNCAVDLSFSQVPEHKVIVLVQDIGRARKKHANHALAVGAAIRGSPVFLARDERHGGSDDG